MKKSILILASITMMSSSILAQKIGTVNSNELVFSMPETKALQTKIQEKQAEYSKKLEDMYKEFQTKAETLKNVNPNKMDAIQEAKMKEVQDLQKRIESFEQTAQKDLQKMEADLSQPILEKAKKNIELVSTEKGYTHVFDVSAGNVLVFPKGDDLTDAVKQKLGISLTSNTTDKQTPSIKK